MALCQVAVLGGRQNTRYFSVAQTALEHTWAYLALQFQGACVILTAFVWLSQQ